MTATTTTTASINDSDLDRLVKLLPLHELSVIRTASQRLSTGGDTPSPLRLSIRAQREVLNTSQGPASGQAHPSADSTPSANPSVSKELLTESELKSIWDTVQRNGNRLEKCLFAVMQTGIRIHKLRELKVSDVRPLGSAQYLHLETPRSGTQERVIALSQSAQVLVDEYIEGSVFSVGAYLFPSAKDAHSPMTSQELSKTFQSWLVQARVEPGVRSAHSIRSSMIAFIARAGMPSLVSMMGHKLSQRTLDYYSPSRDKKKPDA